MSRKQENCESFLEYFFDWVFKGSELKFLKLTNKILLWLKRLKKYIKQNKNKQKTELIEKWNITKYANDE